MNADERQVLATSWLTMQRHWWALEALHRQLKEQPQEAWLTLLCVIETAEDAEMLQTIGAGPLEDLLRSHAEALIASVELEAVANSKLRIALSHVWVRRKRDLEITQRLLALGCQFIGEPA
jgi:hypothetical protein